VKLAISVVTTLCLCMTIGVVAAQAWDEVGDAGELPGSAQVPTGPGPLTVITGLIAANGDADMYLIEITDPACFVATTCNAATSIDTQLWLFDENGMGVTFDDDDPTGCGLQSRITGNACPFPAGCYLLAISTYNNDALNSAGLKIWANSPFGVERCPDGPGAPGPIASWDGAGFSSGTYQIDLSCVASCGGPTPVEPTTWGRLKNIYR